MRKTVAIFVAIMIMLVSAMTASAGTVNVKVNVNQDAVTNLAASLGVPENQLQLIPPATALMEDGQSASKTRILQLGTSVYTIEIPDSYSEGERTEDEIRDGMVAYLNSPDMALDFDIYQFGKEGYPEDLAEYVMQESSEYENACDIVTDGDVNGIDCASYRAREIYDGQEYDTVTYILDGGDEYVEIVFWLDGEEAEAQANEIISSLTFVMR